MFDRCIDLNRFLSVPRVHFVEVNMTECHRKIMDFENIKDTSF